MVVVGQKTYQVHVFYKNLIKRNHQTYYIKETILNLRKFGKQKYD